MTARQSRVATPSRPMVGKVPDRRRKWYPIAVLASQGNRSVHEIMRWIEEGELRAFNSESGWIVHRDHLDKWRELCARPLPAFRSMRALLNAHPELREVRERLTSAVFAKPTYDEGAHKAALAEWDEALYRLGVRFEPSKGGAAGFGAGYGSDIEIPDPDEPGFNPIDRARFSNEKEQEEQ